MYKNIVYVTNGNIQCLKYSFFKVIKYTFRMNLQSVEFTEIFT